MILKITLAAVATIALLGAAIAALAPATTELRHEIRIDRTPDKVWPVLANLLAVRQYNPGVAAVEYASNRTEGVGAERICQFKQGGSARERIVGWESGKAITMEMVESELPFEFMRWRTELDPDGDGTVVRQTLEYRPRFGWFGRLLSVVVIRRNMDGALSEIFENLKRHVESRG
jgi:carbon monoxide dehydrogenase subunit G